MIKDLILLIKKHIATLIEQSKTKPEETLEFELNRQMESFSFSPELNFFEEKKWLSATTNFEATNSVFCITNENSSFSITAPSHWSSRGRAETFNKLQNH